MAPLPIPAPNSQAVNTGGGVPSFIAVWWNFFNSLLGFVVGPGDRVGFTDGSSAPAGDVGEYLHTFVLSGSAVAMLSNTDTQITSLALTAGDWDVTAEAFVTPSGTMTGLIAAINTVVNTTTGSPADGVDQGNLRGISTGFLTTINGLRTRVSIVSPTTYLLVAISLGSAATGYGALRARRVR